MKKLFICEICSTTAAEKIKGKYEAKYHQLTFNLDDVDRFFCHSCGAEYFDFEQERLLSIKVKYMILTVLNI